MKSWPGTLDRPTLAEVVVSPRFGDMTVKFASRVSHLADDDHEGMRDLFEDAVDQLGLDAGVLLSCMRDEDSLYSSRMLTACDPCWLVDYVDERWIDCDPWLDYARAHHDAIRSAELKPNSPAEANFVERSRAFGFNSCVIAPVPTPLGEARYSVLVLGSAQEHFFDHPEYADFRVAARFLASELHLWLVRFLRHDLVQRRNLTPSDTLLLREASMGHRSKQIARQLGVGSTTIDNRFQRVNEKLDVEDRAKAVRIAALYGLFD